jgi:hypothetical protein
VEPRGTEPEAFPPPSLAPSLAASLRDGGAEEGGGRRYLIADVEPLDVTGVRTVTVGTALFAVAFLVLLAFTDDLRAEDRMWWLWTCATGAVLGFYGIWHCRRRAAALAARSRQVRA